MNALPKMHSTKILNFYCKILQLKKTILLRDSLQILLDDFGGDGS